mmetsp:Transcript_66528/g.177134  ORF Transcript_66528/g.177134 Transcript_66528/m.177134 type:complete len:312 (+) Transcript_66528:76-1011(+)
MLEEGFFDDEEPQSAAVRHGLFDVMPWDEYIPFISAAIGMTVGAAWLYSACRREPHEEHSKMRALRRRRGEECALAIVPDGRLDKWNRTWRSCLAPEVYASLRKGETDPPNLPVEEGGIAGLMDEGVFRCAGCATPLYDNEARFEAGCGWPCFWTCLRDAVRERPDADGDRMELICNSCNGHLGHIFRGEKWGFPPPDERHCVNSRSLVFEKKEGGRRLDDPERLAEEAAAVEQGEEGEEGDYVESGYDKWLRHKAEEEQRAEAEAEAARRAAAAAAAHEGEGEEFYSYVDAAEDDDDEVERRADLGAIDD